MLLAGFSLASSQLMREGSERSGGLICEYLNSFSASSPLAFDIGFLSALVLQGFVIVSALLVTALLQFIFDGKPPSLYCLAALPLVIISIFIYQKYPYIDRKKKD